MAERGIGAWVGAAAASWRELTQRVLRGKLARVALVVLWLIGASAVFAPLVANDQPYVMHAIDRGACARASSSLVPLLDEWIDVLFDCDSSDRAGSGARVEPERRAVAIRVAVLREFVPARAVSEALDELEEHMAAAVEAFERDGMYEANPHIAAAHELAVRVRASSTAPASVRTFPLFASLSRADVFALLSWALVPALVFSRTWRRRARLLAACVVAVALAWPWIFEPGKLASTPVKAAAASGELVIESALFPPLAFGFDETNSSEVLRPPTWLASSEIDADGRYVRGARRASADPVTGAAPPGLPVRVLPFESERNGAWRHPLGTDALGRDLLTRLLWGGRASLEIGLFSAAIVIALGITVGALAGWFGRWTDVCLSRAIEVLASFPAVFVIIVVAALIPAHALAPQVAIPLVVGALGWTSVARLVRGEVLRVKQLDYVAAARVLGLSDARILARHVLPNAIQPVIVAVAFLIGWGIFVEAGVSFLGFGVEPPTPSWGALLGHAREPWWTQVFPGAAIAATVIACHALGEALRDALDPRIAV